MPNDGLKCFCMWSDPRRVNRWDDNHRVANLLGIAAIAPDNSQDFQSARLCLYKTMDDIGTHVLFYVAPTDREDEDGIVRVGFAGA